MASVGKESFEILYTLTGCDSLTLARPTVGPVKPR